MKARDETPFSFEPQPLSGRQLDYTIELLTPMVGGGTSSWQCDVKQPVRASEIRQQLRFWWRTLQSPTIDPATLRQQEIALFGGPSRKAKVHLRVTGDSASEDHIECIHVGANGRCNNWKGLPGYALFPLLGQYNPDRTRIQSFSILKAYQFALQITCPSSELSVVEQAVTLWMLFGGLGARTRRGAGSIWSPTLNSRFQSPEAVIAYIKNALSIHTPSTGLISRFPVLQGGKLAMRKIDSVDAREAWELLMSAEGGKDQSFGYSHFRQGRGIARDHGTDRPGRSRWPEADSLRTMRNTWDPGHAPRPHPGEWYPRAAYGLPIQFQFNRHPDHGYPADPEGKHTLLPAPGEKCRSIDRWPSPLILKIGRLGDVLFEVALLLNQQIPPLRWDTEQRASGIPRESHPDAHTGKTFPSNFPLPEHHRHPYAGLFARLFPNCPVHEL